PLAQAELRDRLLGLSDDRLLASNRLEVAGRGVERLAVLARLADPDVDDDLFQAWRLHDVVVLQIVHQRGPDLFEVAGLQARRGARGGAVGLAVGALLSHLCVPQICSPDRFEKRTRDPSGSVRMPIRVGLSVFGQTSATFEMWIAASISTMPAWRAPDRPAFMWRFTMLTSATTMRCVSGRTSRTWPRFPLFLPAITSTVSPRFSLNFGIGPP